jgi:hypothetical protein
MSFTEGSTNDQAVRWRASLDADGYVVVSTGLPATMLEAVIGDIWRHTGADPATPDSWYRPEIIRPRTGMVEMYHYQSMWDIRQHPSMYDIFRVLHEDDALWVSIDRIACKPPMRPDQPDYDQPGFIHWDTDMNQYPDIPLRLQGVLALEDTDEDMGGFQCAPDTFRDQQHFLDGLSAHGPIPRTPDIGERAIVKVPLRAGEMVIWKTTLLHGNGRNTSTRPRLAQYLSMNPVAAGAEQRATLRDSRVSSWERCGPPQADPFPGDPRHVEEQRAQPASLTRLGRQLLGLDDWSPKASS